ncbi:hypothetical protein [uncultured Slackia sp.]|uniref:hypothetical protein n=1 Tax=uncultured Slackia sp. TaxID=665903 RepID=UPI0025E0CE37|nr:hypothetical protein [uncultured Slackia sp.]
MAKHYSAEELGTNFAEIAQEAIESDEPIFISQGGQAQVALVNADTYLQDMQALREFQRIFAK